MESPTSSIETTACSPNRKWSEPGRFALSAGCEAVLTCRLGAVVWRVRLVVVIGVRIGAVTGLDGRGKCLIGVVRRFGPAGRLDLARRGPARRDVRLHPAGLVVGVVSAVVLVCCVVWAAPAAASRSHGSAGVAPAGRVVLRSSLHRIRTGVSRVWASGDYLLSTIRRADGTDAVLINDRLGTTTGLDLGCGVDAFGPPWILMSCQQSSDPIGVYDLELYSIADGTRRTVTPNSGVPPQYPFPSECGTAVDLPVAVRGPRSLPASACATADAVGAYWIRWDASCYHCAATYLFQNIQTGELRDDPANATTFADLNSPALARETCSGVHLIPESLPNEPPWGPLTPDGEFALASGTHNWYDPPTSHRNDGLHWPRRDGLKWPHLASVVVGVDVA